MQTTEKILEWAQAQNGIITTKEISEAGLSRGYLSYLEGKGRLDHVAPGVYMLKGQEPDPLFNLQARTKKGVFAGQTALYIHGLADECPKRLHENFPSTSGKTEYLEEADIICTYNLKKYYEMGIIKADTPMGNPVRVYNVERTICDVIRKKKYVEPDVLQEALRRYRSGTGQNIELLREYGEKLQVLKRFQKYLPEWF